MLTRLIVPLFAAVLALGIVAPELWAQGSVASFLRTLAKGATTAGTPTSTNVDANTQALDVKMQGGSLAANQSVNVSQINGVTPLMGAGNTGTGSPRVTIATDQAAFGVNATLQGVGAVFSFKSTLSGAETALPSNAAKHVCLRASPANTDSIYLGTTGVASTSGYELAAGDAVCLAVSNSNVVHAIVGSGSQILTGLGIN